MQLEPSKKFNTGSSQQKLGSGRLRLHSTGKYLSTTGSSEKLQTMHQKIVQILYAFDW